MNSQTIKIAIINRGIPASGKSTMALDIKNFLAKYGHQVTIHSTDNYFTQKGKYLFDIKKATVNHQKNQKAFSKDLIKGVSVVICDNTNLSPHHTAYYTEAARRHGYFALLLSFRPRNIESHVLASSTKGKASPPHNVPKYAIEGMMEEFAIYSDLLDSAQSEHAQKLNVLFDSDDSIEIYPTKHEEQKELLVLKILELLEAENN